MPFASGTATDYKDLLDKVRRFVAGYGVPGTPAFTGTGNGTMTGIDCYPATLTETWTVTCITVVANGGVFSVVGSVSGAKADATVGTPYDNGLVKFTLNDGSIDFALNDMFTLSVVRGAMSAAGKAWLEKRWTVADQDELILQGPGDDGLQQILVGIQTYYNAASDYYNWKLQGLTGFTSGNTFDQQPGAIPIDTWNCPRLSLWNSAIPYWLAADGSRITMAAKVSTVYEGMYAGFFDVLGTPGQYPYPLAIGGSNGGKTERWSSQDYDRGIFSNPRAYLSAPYKCTLMVRLPNGSWQGFYNWASAGASYLYNTWPQGRISSGIPGALLMRECLNGAYPVIAPVLTDQTNLNSYGALRGVKWIPGYLQAAENTITIGADTYLVVQDTFRNGPTDYWAMLEG